VDSPATYGGAGAGLVLTLAGKSLSALDSRTGQQLWTQSSLPFSGGTIHSNGYISAGLVTGDGFAGGVAVLDARTGQVKWKLEHEGRDRVTPIPGTTDMLHYENGRTLRRLELATGRQLMAADISAQVSGATSIDMTFAGDAVLLLIDQGMPATGGTSKGVVFALADLTVRWEHEGRVTRLSDDLFYAGSSKTGRQVLDAQGRELWRPEEEVQVGRLGSTWGYIKSYAGLGNDLPPETDLYTYVDLRTGNRLAGDSHEQAWFGTAGVLQMLRGGDPQFWFLSLPGGDTTSLGDLPVDWQDCAFSHTHIACFDDDGKPGIWRYRD
jgi:outer membrane protein assembly factor BamB